MNVRVTKKESERHSEVEEKGDGKVSVELERREQMSF